MFSKSSAALPFLTGFFARSGCSLFLLFHRKTFKHGLAQNSGASHAPKLFECPAPRRDAYIPQTFFSQTIFNISFWSDPRWHTHLDFFSYRGWSNGRVWSILFFFLFLLSSSFRRFCERLPPLSSVFRIRCSAQEFHVDSSSSSPSYSK